MLIKDGFKATIESYYHADKPESRINKTKILLSAMDCFLNDGYHVSTIELIAKEANCSKNAVFYHFKTKEYLASSMLKMLQLFYKKHIFNFKMDQKNPRQSIRELIELIAGNENGCKCYLGLLEILDREMPALRVAVEDIKTQWIDFLCKMLQPLNGLSADYLARIGFIFIMKHTVLRLKSTHDENKATLYLKRSLRLIWVGHILS